MDKILAKIETCLILLIVFLVPIFVFSLAPNPFIIPKLVVMAFGISLILLIKVIRILLSGNLKLSIGNFDFAVFLILAAYLLSALFRTPNKMEAFLFPGTATAVIASGILYFLINQLDKKEKYNIKLALLGSGLLFAFITLVSSMGILSQLTFLPALIRSRTFNPEGGYLPSAIFLAILIPLGIGLIIEKRSSYTKIFVAISMALIISAFGLAVFNLLPGKAYAPIFPGNNVSWPVAVDALKESPILGVGPSNYLTAFSRFRPIIFNSSKVWATKFTTANNFYLTLLTETGLLGLASILLIFFSVYKVIKKELEQRKSEGWNLPQMANLASLLLLLVIFVFLPATNLHMLIMFVLLALITDVRTTNLPLVSQAPNINFTNTNKITSRLPAFLVSLPILVAVILFAFYGSRVVLAEYRFKKAMNYAAKNDGQKTYQEIRKAITLNPYVDRYHAAFVQLNLSLANNVAQKKTVGDEDKKAISVFIQEAIAQAKATVALNPKRAGNWEILGQTYRAIIPLAKNADTFALQVYGQAVALDPINPNLRIALGSLYYSLKDYDTAERILELAVAVKPDLANSHYNLAFSYRDNGKIDKAINQMTIVLSLVDKNSKDYQTAKTALEDLEKAKPTKDAVSGENLTAPQVQPTPILKPPVELPAGSQPPASVVSPTPEISPTPTP